PSGPSPLQGGSSMRRASLVLTAALALAALAPTGRAVAQVAGPGSNYDVFSFYYGYYLPHQAYIAAQPTPLDTINHVNAQRQVGAQTARTALCDPISPYGDEEASLQPYSGRKRKDRGATVGRFAADGSNSRGNGPAAYYGRSAQYFPGLRAGRGTNQNL